MLLFPLFKVYRGSKIVYKPIRFSQQQTLLYAFTLMTLSVFGFSDYDFWGCMQGYINYKKNSVSGVYEPFYEWLTDITPNYFVWRFIVWGIAVYLMVKTLNRLRVNFNATYLFITLLYVLSFYKLRNVLGFSVMFWGLSLIIRPGGKHRTTSIISGMIFIILSFWCHKTMIISISLLICCYFKFTKARLNVLILAWPFLIYVVTILLSNFTAGLIVLENNDMGLASRAMTYATNEGETSNLNGMIRTVIIESAVIIPLIYVTKKIVYQHEFIPTIIKYFYRYWFATTYIAYLFAFQNAANWIYIRIATMGYFPMCIVLGWYWANHRRTLAQRLIILLCLLAYSYSTFYMVYKMDLINTVSINL